MNRLNYYRRQRKGYTLLELICVLSVSSIIMVALFAILSNSISLMKNLENTDENYLSGSFAMDYFESEISAAEAVYPASVAPLNSLLGESIGFILQIQSDKYVTYGLVGTNLRRYTAGKLEGFKKSSTILGNNLLEENIVEANSSIDTDKGILKVHLIVKKGATGMDFDRNFSIPKEESQ